MQILSVVIGIVFVLLLLSLLATTIMELLASFFSLRGRNLLKALRNMLASSDDNELLLTEFRQNSLYRQLTEQFGRRSRADAPSYMSATNFQSILFDIILKGDGVENLAQRIDQLPDADLRNVLKQLLRESGGQLDNFRLQVQNWYENVMDRAGGWYKRYTQKILIFMGLGIAVLFNADTLTIYERLSANPAELERIVAQAEAYVGARPNSNPSAPSTNYNGPIVPPSLPNGNSETQALDQLKSQITAAKTLIDQEISPLGLGWTGQELNNLDVYTVITKLLGYLLTALAISLGAPFWFDLLRKFVNIRASGNKPAA
ncbi:MAG: hypothetical protein HC821_01485 [Lewinella sp.]|nr:hypothetical protein [Lewinella sp.]